MTMISFFCLRSSFFWIESLYAVSSVMTKRLTLVLLELNLPSTHFSCLLLTVDLQLQV